MTVKAADCAKTLEVQRGRSPRCNGKGAGEGGSAGERRTTMVPNPYFRWLLRPWAHGASRRLMTV